MSLTSSVSLTRRRLLQWLSIGSTGLMSHRLVPVATAETVTTPPPEAVGLGPNVYWNSVGPYVLYPQKAPLIRLTDRPIQLETPRHYFYTAFTPNEAFFVRYHLPGEPNRIDLTAWRLHVEGKVKRPLTLSFKDLLQNYEAVEVAAVNQCAGNSRSYFQPRVTGGQWGHGAMGNARWVGVRLRELIEAADLTAGAVQVQFQGLDFGAGSPGNGSHLYLKSWDVEDPALDEAIVAYAMNGEPLPMLNGFPVRMVFPGKFATYWVKAVTWIRVLDQQDDNFWMAKGYRIPNTPTGDTTPEAVATGKVEMVPIGVVDMPVRSFIISPDGASKLPVGLPITLKGIAFSGSGRVTKVEISTDDGRSWQKARLSQDYGPYSFRTWVHLWIPEQPGEYVLAVRATDERGHVQSDKAVWNPGGYLLNRIERQPVTVGSVA